MELPICKETQRVCQIDFSFDKFNCKYVVMINDISMLLT